jgi:hypothetical protein
MKKRKSVWICHFLLSAMVLILLAACQAGANTKNPADNTPTSVVEKLLTQTPRPTSTRTSLQPTAAFTPTLPQGSPTPTEKSANPTPLAESTQTAVINIFEPDHPCYHPYLPVDPNHTWIYQYQSEKVSDGSMSTTFDTTARRDSFLVSQSMADGQEKLTNEINWYCSKEGLASGSFAVVDMPEADFQYGEITTEGITLPAIQSFQPGSQWQIRYETESKMKYQGMTFEGDVFVAQNNTFTGFEIVSVPAGTFDAARVDSTYTIQIAIGGFKMNVAQASGTVWYAESIGLVKSTVTMQDHESIQELVSIN